MSPTEGSKSTRSCHRPFKIASKSLPQSYWLHTFSLFFWNGFSFPISHFYW